jgi:hypothetical protein
MTFIFQPILISLGEQHRHSLWTREECYRFYVEQRRLHCNHMQILYLWLQAPHCQDCIFMVEPWRDPLPEIAGGGWQVDMLLGVGNGFAVAAEAEALAQEDADYAFQCKRCQCDLRPWDGDSMWVVDYHLEDHYGIPLETPGRRKPSRKIRDRIFQLYDRKCFRCGSPGPLHIDHICPRASGGDSAFRNLQPLCDACGNLKGDTEPEEVRVYNPLYFTGPPSDGWEGLFW